MIIISNLVIVAAAAAAAAGDMLSFVSTWASYILPTALKLSQLAQAIAPIAPMARTHGPNVACSFHGQTNNG